MRFVWELIFMLLILCASISFIFSSFSLSSYGNLGVFWGTRIFVFSIFSVVFSTVLVKWDRESVENFDGIMTFLSSLYQLKYDLDEARIYESCSDSDEDTYSYDSDGYEEDEDEEDDENDESLTRRVEDFIAMMIRGWREELLMENINNKQKD
ncbi:Hypothetical predicted protein [Olea europaea subsp. europaea]|uniref:Uncharacterized protein n=1 Tax=Olea europaea subsp. europaea TaxID=158383 RepID=A0A8S0VNU0_OLEEU|nr:Hypothetical predicted protein [Olea europaea subsp. europaea]